MKTDSTKCEHHCYILRHLFSILSCKVMRHLFAIIEGKKRVQISGKD